MRWAGLIFAIGLCNAQETRDAATVLRDLSRSAREAESWLIEGHTEIASRDGGKEPSGDFKLAWREPGFSRYEFGDPDSSLVVCDGEAVWTYFPRANHYTKVAVSEQRRAQGNGAAWRSRCEYFLGEWEKLADGIESAVFVGKDTAEFGGERRECQVIRAEYPADIASHRGRQIRVLCVDPERNLILHERVETDYVRSPGLPGAHRIRDTKYTAIQRNPQLDPELFRFDPPEGSTATYEARGAIAEGVTTPVLLDRREPKYTKSARVAGIQGVVLLSAEVGPDGRAHNIRVLHSLDPGLDQNAIECVESWKFRPATKDGQPVAVRANVEVSFRLLDK
jgi:TonB family protein